MWRRNSAPAKIDHNWSTVLVDYLGASKDAITYARKGKNEDAIAVLKRTASDSKNLEIAQPFFDDLLNPNKHKSDILGQIYMTDMKKRTSCSA
tara:strand:+ start:1211 stop:1489 length:279 start_codon:yes stop_codon:yes gene_type:complete